MVKIVLAVIATIELGAVTIQGAASYAEYRYDDGTYYKGCDFYSDESQHDPDVNFLTIVIVIGTATLFWVSTRYTQLYDKEILPYRTYLYS